MDVKKKGNSFEDNLKIVDEEIRYIPAVNDGWSLPINELKAFGELTTNDGPVAGDYYLIFVTGENEWKVATAYVANQKDFLTDLSKKLNCTIALNLFSSTNWKSNILWPVILKGNDLIEFKELQPINWWERVRKKFGMGSPLTLVLTEQVKQFIRTAR